MFLVGLESELKADSLAQSVCHSVKSSVALALVDLRLTAADRCGHFSAYPVAFKLGVMLLRSVYIGRYVEVFLLEDVIDLIGFKLLVHL